MIHFQEPKSPCKVFHKDVVRALPPSGDRSYSSGLVISEICSQTPIFLPCHKDEIAMDTALSLWDRVISHTGLFKNIMSDRDPKFTSALWTNLHRLFGTKLSFSTAYHPQTHGLAVIMIKIFEDMIRRFFAYGLEFKYLDGFNHEWFTLIPALELAYKTTVHSSTASSFIMILDKVKHHEKQRIYDAFDFARQKWDRSHKVPDFKIGDLVLVSTLNLNNIKGPKKLQDSYVGPFVIVALHGTNSAQVELSVELDKKHPNFPVSLIKLYQTADE
ncbi:hypothetical protein O181_054313 [Austropuccinia psidii MF-1]|uniref:Integrase catalytic domain-containing protein n=1 Tax=Austropuccinia psidii MF-1 TaxID=1389203 RepID=A0A9Q3HRB1_9BASI|nr:hypothetical protein [Austropuccinia psidii MF-1]